MRFAKIINRLGTSFRLGGNALIHLGTAVATLGDMADLAIEDKVVKDEINKVSDIIDEAIEKIKPHWHNLDQRLTLVTANPKIEGMGKTMEAHRQTFQNSLDDLVESIKNS